MAHQLRVPLIEPGNIMYADAPNTPKDGSLGDLRVRINSSVVPIEDLAFWSGSLGRAAEEAPEGARLPSLLRQPVLPT